MATATLDPNIIENIIRTIREWIIAALPKFAAGTVVAPKKGWITVTYKDPTTGLPVVISDPHVVAITEYKTGTYTPPRYEIPPISIFIPEVKVPTVGVPPVKLPIVPEIPAVKIARIRREDLRETTARSYGEAARDFVRGISIPWPLSEIRNWLADTLFYGVGYAIGYIAGAFMNWLWDSMIQPQIDKVTDAINEGLSTARGRVQTALNMFKSNVDSSLTDFRSSIQTAFNRSVSEANTALETLRRETTGNINKTIEEVTDKVEAAVNDTIRKIYESLEGIGVGVQIGKPQIANVTSRGFDWYAQDVGVKLHYICVGR